MCGSVSTFLQTRLAGQLPSHISCAIENCPGGESLRRFCRLVSDVVLLLIIHIGIFHVFPFPRTRTPFLIHSGLPFSVEVSRRGNGRGERMPTRHILPLVFRVTRWKIRKYNWRDIHPVDWEEIFIAMAFSDRWRDHARDQHLNELNVHHYRRIGSCLS